MEIRRFGVGNRRPDGPPGTTGVEAQVSHGDARGVIAEPACRKGARIEPHENPNTTWLIVVEGGGYAGGRGAAARGGGEAVLAGRRDARRGPSTDRCALVSSSRGRTTPTCAAS